MMFWLLGTTWDRVGDWAAGTGVKIAGVVTVVFIVNTVLRHAVRPTVERAVLRESTSRTELDLRKRADTLSSVLIRTAQVGVLLIGALLILAEVGYNIAPLLTGLGIGGIALGLGAQSLVRDTISGIFILIENQYGRGDLVSIAGVQGWVEDINLRRTVVRDLDGTLFSVPNGEVKVAGNLTRGFSGISFVVPLLYTGDLDRAIALIDEAGQEVAADPHLGPLIVEPPRAVRVEGLGEKAVMLRVLGRTAPGAQFEVAGALRRRIKQAFDQADLRFGEVAPPAPPARPPS